MENTTNLSDEGTRTMGTRLMSNLERFRCGPTYMISRQHHSRMWPRGYQPHNYHSTARRKVLCVFLIISTAARWIWLLTQLYIDLQSNSSSKYAAYLCNTVTATKQVNAKDETKLTFFLSWRAFGILWKVEPLLSPPYILPQVVHPSPLAFLLLI